MYDGTSRRAVPAFLSNARSRDEVATHRAYLAAALNRELTRCGSHMIRSDSSAAMFEAFVRLVVRDVGAVGPEPVAFRRHAGIADRRLI